jgi:hypothetical protein
VDESEELSIVAVIKLFRSVKELACDLEASSAALSVPEVVRCFKSL